jgi:hypothetical protein
MSVVSSIIIRQTRKDKQMGQYHSLYNLDKREVLHPHDLGLGAKQWEHTGTSGGLSDLLYALTTTSPMRGGGDFICEEPINFLGRWVGDRVVVVGDYAEQGDIPNYNLQEEKLHNFRSISDVARTFSTAVWGIEFELGQYGMFIRKYPANDWRIRQAV